MYKCTAVHSLIHAINVWKITLVCVLSRKDSDPAVHKELNVSSSVRTNNIVKPLSTKD
jgi:hypothetical protein